MRAARSISQARKYRREACKAPTPTPTRHTAEVNHTTMEPSSGGSGRRRTGDGRVVDGHEPDRAERKYGHGCCILEAHHRHRGRDMNDPTIRCQRCQIDPRYVAPAERKHKVCKVPQTHRAQQCGGRDL